MFAIRRVVAFVNANFDTLMSINQGLPVVTKHSLSPILNSVPRVFALK